ncbi:MAG: C39 family peptidase [Mycobacterium sp.]|uniref:C39 family peptidase n=1 Tax=Mycobacterium sp. TaxID=1785 RepID=UPI003C58E5F5
MTSTLTAKVGATARSVRIAALLCAAAAPSLVTSAAAVHAAPSAPAPNASQEVGMYGDPSAAAPYWRQQHSSDCGEMAVADLVGQITGHEPTEQQITALAKSTPSTAGAGSIWDLPANTDIRDLPVLLAHYRIKADNIQTSINALEQDLAEKRGVIVLLNAETIWNRPGKRNAANHFVVVTGIDAKAGAVHLNDSGIVSGRDEQVPIATFEQAWAPNHNSAIVTK